MLQPGSFIARVTAVGILGVLLLASFQLIIEPLIRTYRENQEEIVRSHELLQRYRALAAERPSLIERLSALEEDDESLAGYLKGPSDALAAAELQDLAAEVIEATDGEIRSTQILPATEIESSSSVRRAGLKLRFAATIDGLASALYDLETVEPHLFIDQLVVVAKQTRRSEAKADDDLKLDIRLDIFGYVRQQD